MLLLKAHNGPTTREQHIICTKTTVRSNIDVLSGSTAPQFVAVTGWMPAMSVRRIKFIIDVIERSPNLYVAVAIQTATTDTDLPGTWVVKGGWRSTTGKNCSGMLDISTDVDDDFFVRIGLGSKNSSGSALERGEVSLALSMSAS